MSSSNGNDFSARLKTFSDREILAIMNDVAGGMELYVNVDQLAVRAFAVSVQHEEEMTWARRCFGSRLSWMRRWGMVEKGSTKGMWIETPEGRAFRQGKIPQSIKRSIDTTTTANLPSVLAAVGERFIQADAVGATFMRREWEHQRMRRKMLNP